MISIQDCNKETIMMKDYDDNDDNNYNNNHNFPNSSSSFHLPLLTPSLYHQSSSSSSSLSLPSYSSSSGESCPLDIFYSYSSSLSSSSSSSSSSSYSSSSELSPFEFFTPYSSSLLSSPSLMSSLSSSHENSFVKDCPHKFCDPPCTENKFLNETNSRNHFSRSHCCENERKCIVKICKDLLCSHSQLSCLYRFITTRDFIISPNEPSFKPFSSVNAVFHEDLVFSALKGFIIPSISLFSNTVGLCLQDQAFGIIKPGDKIKDFQIVNIPIHSNMMFVSQLNTPLGLLNNSSMELSQMDELKSVSISVLQDRQIINNILYFTHTPVSTDTDYLYIKNVNFDYEIIDISLLEKKKLIYPNPLTFSIPDKRMNNLFDSHECAKILDNVTVIEMMDVFLKIFHDYEKMSIFFHLNSDQLFFPVFSFSYHQGKIHFYECAYFACYLFTFYLLVISFDKKPSTSKLDLSLIMDKILKFINYSRKYIEAVSKAKNCQVIPEAKDNHKQICKPLQEFFSNAIPYMMKDKKLNLESKIKLCEIFDLGQSKRINLTKPCFCDDSKIDLNFEINFIFPTK